MSDWAHAYFERGYAQRWNLAPPSEASAHEVGWLWNELLLRPNDRVADIGCGHGKYAFALASHGASVVGVDSASALLQRARRFGAKIGTPLWVQGDMRFLPLCSSHFQAAVLFDAFGFFEREEENELVLSELGRVLTPTGRVALRVANAEPILRAFRATDREEQDGVTVDVTRMLELEPPRLIERIVINGPTGRGEFERRQRLYRLPELRSALQRKGLSVKSVSADISGASFHHTSSSAMFVVAEVARAA